MLWWIIGYLWVGFVAVSVGGAAEFTTYFDDREESPWAAGVLVAVLVWPLLVLVTLTLLIASFVSAMRRQRDEQ